MAGYGPVQALSNWSGRRAYPVASGVRILECGFRSWRIQRIVRSSNVAAGAPRKL